MYFTCILQGGARNIREADEKNWPSMKHLAMTYEEQWLLDHLFNFIHPTLLSGLVNFIEFARMKSLLYRRYPKQYASEIDFNVATKLQKYFWQSIPKPNDNNSNHNNNSNDNRKFPTFDYVLNHHLSPTSLPRNQIIAKQIVQHNNNTYNFANSNSSNILINSNQITNKSYYMHFICILYAFYMYFICILYVFYMYFICILYAFYMYLEGKNRKKKKRSNSNFSNSNN